MCNQKNGTFNPVTCRALVDFDRHCVNDGEKLQIFDFSGIFFLCLRSLAGGDRTGSLREQGNELSPGGYAS